MFFIHTVMEPSFRLSPDLLCSPNWNPVSMKPYLLQHLVSTIILFLFIWLQRSPTCRSIQFLFFFDWLISLNIISLRFTPVAWSQNFLPFKGWIIFHCTDRPHCTCPSICWRTLELVPRFGCCEYECTNAHLCLCFQFVMLHTQKWNCWIIC